MPTAESFLRSLADKSRDTLEIDQGTIQNIAHTFGQFGRVKNWVAIVTKDYTAPGGLHRDFFKRGPQDRVFLPADLASGQWLEFGGDKVTSGGKRKNKRQYREVVSLSETVLELKPIDFSEIGRAAEVEVNPPDSGSDSSDRAASDGPEPSGLSFVKTEVLISELNSRGYSVTKAR